MSPLILAFLLAAQAPDAPNHCILSNDRPQFPIGLVKEMKLLEDVNLAAVKDPLRVADFMERSAKQGGLLEVPSGTKAKQLATHKLRGPVFKEIIQVEVSEGDQKGLRGWIAWKALMSPEEFAAVKAGGEAHKFEKSEFTPLYRDPLPGETAYLAPQPTMFGMTRTLIRLAVADNSAATVFKEWQGAPDSSRDAVIKMLEHKKSIFFTTVNTEVKVQKVFPAQMIHGIYPVQVELVSGQFKGKIGWAPVTVVSPVPGTSHKTAQTGAEKGKTEIERTIELRNQRKNKRAKTAAQHNAEIAADAAKQQEQQRRDQQLQAQLRLQMLQQQGALAEARAADSRADAYRQMSQNIRQHQLREAQRNGEALAYTPNGPMTQEEFRRSQNNPGPQNNADNEP
jgi:hypothetical protein